MNGLLPSGLRRGHGNHDGTIVGLYRVKCLQGSPHLNAALTETALPDGGSPQLAHCRLHITASSRRLFKTCLVILFLSVLPASVRCRVLLHQIKLVLSCPIKTSHGMYTVSMMAAADRSLPQKSWEHSVLGQLSARDALQSRPFSKLATIRRCRR